MELPFSRVRTPGPSLSFTTASLPGNSPGSNPGTNPSSQPEATTSKTEMPPSGGVPSPVVAAPRSEKEEPSAPFLREPPQLARARKKSPVKVAAHEGQTGGKTPVEVEAQPKAPRRAKEKVTPRAVSQIEVANPRSLSKGASLAGSAAPTTAASRRELFRWSSVLVHAGGTPGAEAEEKFRADFLHSQRSVHPVAEEEGEGESAAATPESARASPKKEAAKEERKLHCLVVDDVHTNR